MSRIASMLRPRAPETEADPEVYAGRLRLVLSEADAADYLRQVMAALSQAPRWVPGWQELWWHGRPVKRFCRVAGNQTPVLVAFQAAGWPRRIDDPLPDLTGRKNKKRRLQTVRSLNERLEPGTIRFRADGTGRGICWEEVR